MPHYVCSGIVSTARYCSYTSGTHASLGAHELVYLEREAFLRPSSTLLLPISGFVLQQETAYQQQALDQTHEPLHSRRLCLVLQFSGAHTHSVEEFLPKYCVISMFGRFQNRHQLPTTIIRANPRAIARSLLLTCSIA